MGSGRLADAQIRAVSYGEARSRQVRPGATGEAGRDNRRVSLVIDYTGSRSMPATSTPEQQQSTAQSGT